MTAERHQIGIALLEDRLGTLRFETSRGDDFPLEDLAQPLRCNRRLAFCDEHVTLHSRFNNVEICEPEAVQLPDQVVEQRSRVAVRHPVKRSARANAHRNPVAAPHRRDRLHNFQHEAAAVFDRTAIGIGSLIAAVLQKLIGQIAVGSVKFDALKARGSGSLRGLAIILDDARDFSDVQRAVRRRLLPSVRRRLFYRWILPILRLDRRADWGYAVRRVHMRGAPRVPELGEHVPAFLMNCVRDSSPTRNLFVRIQAGRPEPSAARNRNRSSFRNYEPTF